MIKGSLLIRQAINWGDRPGTGASEVDPDDLDDITKTLWNKVHRQIKEWGLEYEDSRIIGSWFQKDRPKDFDILVKVNDVSPIIGKKILNDEFMGWMVDIFITDGETTYVPKQISPQESIYIKLGNTTNNIKLIRIADKIDFFGHNDLSDKIESLFVKIAQYYKGWATVSWISSSGEEFDTEGDTHQGWIFKNILYLEEEHEFLSKLKDEAIEEEDEYRTKEIKRLKSDFDYYQDDPDMREECERIKIEINKLEEEMGNSEDILSHFTVSGLVSRLIGIGWIRKVDKHGKLHYEYSGDKSIRIIEENLIDDLGDKDKRMGRETVVILEDLDIGYSGEFKIGDWLSSGLTLKDFMETDSIIYGRTRWYR